MYVDQIESACKYLAPGFTCVAILNKEGLIRQKDQDLLFNTADLVYAYGAHKIVYVRKSNSQIPGSVENATDIQEADDILDEKTSGRLQLNWGIGEFFS